MEWVDSSWCDSNQRESSRNIFDSNLESSQCDSNLQNFRAQISTLKLSLRLDFFEDCVVYEVFH